MREFLDGYHVEERKSFTDLMLSSELFVSKRVGDRVFATPNYGGTAGENPRVHPVLPKQGRVQGLADGLLR